MSFFPSVFLILILSPIILECSIPIVHDVVDFDPLTNTEVIPECPMPNLHDVIDLNALTNTEVHDDHDDHDSLIDNEGNSSWVVLFCLAAYS